jgi:DNA repair photolyase
MRLFDPWNSPLCTCPLKFTLNPYTGCAHGCIYCYARSYIRNFNNPRPKKKLILNLLHDLDFIPKGSIISMSESSDPYTPPEAKYGITRKVLETLNGKKFRILIVTKSDLVLRDADILKNNSSSVALTITTYRSEIASKIEPGAPTPSRRLNAIKRLSNEGIPVVARIDPIIPYINDDPNELKNLVQLLSKLGVKQIISSTYKARRDSLKRLISVYPHLKEKLVNLYIRNGSWRNGYYYLPIHIRLKYMILMKKLTENLGLAFATCREGLTFLHTPGMYCDGSSFLFY